MAKTVKELLDMDGARALLEEVNGKGWGGSGGGNDLGLYRDKDGDICQRDD